MVTVAQAFRQITGFFNTAGIESPQFDAMQLVEAVSGVPRYRIAQENSPLALDRWEQLRQMAKRRAEGYPLQYLLGEWEFFGMTVAVGEGVLIPRQDTEALVETAISLLKDVPQPVVADLCSGSGCIAMAIARHLPQSRVLAVELSPEAFPYLQRNLAGCGLNDVTAIQGDIFDPEVQRQVPACDLIVSNPPYVTEQEMAALQREVTFEPKMALYAPDNGLYFYKKIACQYYKKLKPGGWLAVEIGWRQGDDVTGILSSAGYEGVCLYRDLTGKNRVAAGKRSL